MQNNFNHLFGLLNEVYNILTNETHNNTCSVFFGERMHFIWCRKQKYAKHTNTFGCSTALFIDNIENRCQFVSNNSRNPLWKHGEHLCILSFSFVLLFAVCSHSPIQCIADSLSLSLSPLSLWKLSTEFRAGALSFRVWMVISFLRFSIVCILSALNPHSAQSDSIANVSTCCYCWQNISQIFLHFNIFLFFF